jgi:hypothetical protein
MERPPGAIEDQAAISLRAAAMNASRARSTVSIAAAKHFLKSIAPGSRVSYIRNDAIIASAALCTSGDSVISCTSQRTRYVSW